MRIICLKYLLIATLIICSSNGKTQSKTNYQIKAMQLDRLITRTEFGECDPWTPWIQYDSIMEKSRWQELVTGNFPILEGIDKETDEMINNEIKRYIVVNSNELIFSKRKQFRFQANSCRYDSVWIADNPSKEGSQYSSKSVFGMRYPEIVFSYDVNKNTNKLLSLSIHSERMEDEGREFSDSSLFGKIVRFNKDCSINFDVTRKKKLLFFDVFDSSQVDTLKNILAKNMPYFYDDDGYIEDLLEFVIQNKSLWVRCNASSYDHSGQTSQFEIPIQKYSYLFSKDFLKLIET